MTSRNNLPHIQAKQFLSGGIEPTDYIAQSEAISVREITHKLLSDTDYRFSRYEIEAVSNVFYGKEKQAPYMDLIRERICKNIFLQLQKSVERYTILDKDIVFEQSIYQSFVTLESISKSQFIQEQLPALKIQFQELTKAKMPDNLD